MNKLFSIVRVFGILYECVKFMEISLMLGFKIRRVAEYLRQVANNTDVERVLCSLDDVKTVKYG